MIVQLKEKKSCVTSFIGWERLEKHLHKSGELKESEFITHLEVTEHGIQYYVDKEKQ